MSLRVKKALKKLVAYSPDDVDFEIRLNANEAPFDFIIAVSYTHLTLPTKA